VTAAADGEAFPPAYQASTSVLLADSATESFADALQTDVARRPALAESRIVAEHAMRQLVLRQSIGSFLAATTVMELTDRVVLFTVSPPSKQASGALTGMAQLETGCPAPTASIVDSSQVLDAAAPFPQSRRHLAVKYVCVSLAASLALGLSLIIVQVLASGRLRRRADIAAALGVPISLNVRIRGRRLPSRRGLGLDRAVQRIVARLRNVRRGTAALGVVAVDGAQVGAVSLATLAVSCAREGRRVMVADPVEGASAAQLLGGGAPGVCTVSVDGTQLSVAVPDRRDAAPEGPVCRASLPAGPSADEALTAAYASANLLLSGTRIDASLGADHVAWATDIVAVVTVGRSSATRLRAIREALRLAGRPLISTVLVGAEADKRPEMSQLRVYRRRPALDLGIIGR
jgi:capsular polysaccharide biosynthesis protein